MSKQSELVRIERDGRSSTTQKRPRGVKSFQTFGVRYVRTQRSDSMGLAIFVPWHHQEKEES